MKEYFFIHIPKTGGTALRLFTFLEHKVQDANSNFNISRDYTNQLHMLMASLGDHHGDEHARFQDINPGMIIGMKRCAIIRNPWDRVASRYFFAKQLINQGKVPENYADVSSFEAFLEERWKWGDIPFLWHRAVRGWYPCLSYVVDAHGRIAVDILRYESYNEDVQRYFNVGFDVPRRNETVKSCTYRDIYTNETIQTVADWYRPDIDRFGYDFDTGPTRNTWALK